MCVCKKRSKLSTELLLITVMTMMIITMMNDAEDNNDDDGNRGTQSSCIMNARIFQVISIQRQNVKS